MGRFRVMDSLDFLGGGVVQKILLHPISNHCLALLLGDSGSLWGPCLFRFENMWLKSEGLRILSKVGGKALNLEGLVVHPG